MNAKLLALPLLLALLAGCSVRTAPPPKAVDTLNAPAASNQSGDLDKSNTFLAETTVPMAKLGATLRKIGKFDAHLKWDDAFIKQTVTEVSLLKQNDRIEGPMYAKSGETSAEVQVVVIRVDQDKFAVRAISSNKIVADAIGQALK